MTMVDMLIPLGVINAFKKEKHSNDFKDIWL